MPISSRSPECARDVWPRSIAECYGSCRRARDRVPTFGSSSPGRSFAIPFSDHRLAAESAPRPAFGDELRRVQEEVLDVGQL